MKTQRTRLAIIGGGPAGATAAVRAAALGVEALLIDEAPAAGGQVYRAPDTAHAAPDDGDRLRSDLAASGVTCLFGHRLWHIDPARRLMLAGPEGPLIVEAEAIIVATGSIERFHPFPGWTLPGVIGLAAATIMLKAHAILPGRQVLVAGPGPLAPLVANGIRRAGGTVVALADPLPLNAWLRALPAFAVKPADAVRGIRWLSALRSAGTPILRGHRIVRIVKRGDDLHVDLADRAGAIRSFTADAVCAGAGLQPSTDVVRLLGAATHYDVALGGWVPSLDRNGRTSIPLTYAAGDGAGIRGASAAAHAGAIATLAAAVDLGVLPQGEADSAIAGERRALARAALFGEGMTRLMMPPARALADVPDETIVCRCEDIDVGALRSAIAAGATSLGALKSATRCGMGPCGGRVCSEGATALIEETGLSRAAIPAATARPPLRPVPVAALAGSFAYADIPLPEPSPA